MSPQEFGGKGWTEPKLLILSKFLGFFTSALKKQHFRLVYVDAFAGTGTRLDRDGSGAVEVLPGSALKALEVDPPFNRYVFIEVDPAKAEELQGCIPVGFTKIVEVIPGDANDHMKSIATGWNRKTDRGVVFLDPFAMRVDWSTLQAIAATESMDLWLLFPISAVMRTLPRIGNPPEEWREALIRVFGEDPTPLLYEREVQPSLLGDDPDVPIPDEELDIRKGGTRSLATYVLSRLRSIFKGGVQNRTLVLKNSKNSPMFLLIFCLANPGDKARALAMKGVQEILNKHAKEGGDVATFGD